MIPCTMIHGQVMQGKQSREWPEIAVDTAVHGDKYSRGRNKR